MNLDKQKHRLNHGNSVDDLLQKFNLKACFVKLELIGAMETVRKPGRPGRKPKANNAASVGAATAAAAAGTTPEPKSPSVASDKGTGKKAIAKNSEDLTILSGGRGKRTPKPNPRYMNETTLSSTKISIKDDSAGSETNDDEMDEILSSDDYRSPSDMPLKKRNLHQKMLQKATSSAKKQNASQKLSPGGNPARKTIAPTKRKLNDADIDIDDDHGKQLFLAAKRRLTNSRSNSDDDFDQSKKSPKGDTSALAAKLRAKYSDNLIVKRTNNNKTLPVSRGRGRPSAKITRVTKRDADAAEFEQMPTFTIVNINDIISQKDGEEVVIKKQKKADDTETSEDEINAKATTSDQESSPKNANNRRKTQHTKILSDDKVVRTTRRMAAVPITAKATTPTAIQNRLAHGNSKIVPLPKSFQTSPRGADNNGRFRDGSTKPAILRPPPPRILNSTLCKPSNKATVPSLVTKLVTKNDFDEISNKQNNNTISSRSKENNVTSYTYTEKDGKVVPKRQQMVGQPQRKTILPVVRQQQVHQRCITSPPSNANLQQSKSIRKITCFETWYVIKMAETKQNIDKSSVSLSLLNIGNGIKEIELPSTEWSYKTILQPIDKQQIVAAKKTKPNDKSDEDATKSDSAKENDSQHDTSNDDSDAAKSDVYTGDVHDPNIDPNERHKYQPTTIMFRRKCQNPKVRIQFDRTVIFKNQTFYLNVDGKNVKLLGAPLVIESFDDIKVLLEIINDVNLTSSCIELTSHPL